MRYLNEKCPVCGNAFTEDDDVVVCPYCATPHHRECYTNLGKCFNEDKHEDGFVWEKTETKEEKPEEEKTQENADFVVCPECGTKNKKNALICSNCTSALNSEIREQFEPSRATAVFINGMPVDNEATIDEDNSVTVREAACFIQKGKESYIKTFLDAKSGKRKPKFNIWAFIFGAYWFFYRKMYKPGFAFLGIEFALSIFNTGLVYKVFPAVVNFITEHFTTYSELIAFISGNPAVDSALYEEYYAIVNKCFQDGGVLSYVIIAINIASILIRVFAGFKANGFYLDFVKTSVAKIKKAIPHPGAYFTYLYAKGGASFLTPALIWMAVYYINQMILSYALK